MSIFTAMNKSKIESKVPNSKYIRTENEGDKSEPKKEGSDTPAETDSK